MCFGDPIRCHDAWPSACALFCSYIKKLRYTPTHEGNTKGWYANEVETLSGDAYHGYAYIGPVLQDGGSRSVDPVAV